MRKVAIVVSRYNPSRLIASHLFGKQHSIKHRLAIGVLVFCSGFFVTKIHISYHAIQVLLELGGWLLHAAGAHPVIEWWSED